MIDAQDELLNGAFGGPVWGGTPTVAAVPQNIREAAPSGAATVSGSAPQAIMIAWVAVLILVVLAHVLTFQVQK